MDMLVVLLVGLALLVIIGSIGGLVAGVRCMGLQARIEDLERAVCRLKSRLLDAEQAGKRDADGAAPRPIVPLPWMGKAPPESERKGEDPIAPQAMVGPSAAPGAGAPVSGPPFPPTVAAKPDVSIPPPASSPLLPALWSKILSPHAPPSSVSATSSRATMSHDQEWWRQFEERLGKHWITWVGAVVLFLGAGFFIKYAFERQWLGPTARVVLGVAFGLALIAAGARFVRRRMGALGQGLMGAGLAIVYVSLYAAFAVYHILSVEKAFVLLVIVTAGGMMLAVVLDAVAIGFLAVLGGFLTPMLLSTGTDARDAFFSYLLLLDLGALGVAAFRRWRALDILAFVGTWALYTGWFTDYYTETALVPTMLWLGAFYLVFLLHPFLYHLCEATPIRGERFAMACANAATMFGYAWYLLHACHGHVLGNVSLGMSLCYMAMGAVTRARVRSDARALFGFVALAMMFLTLAVPLHLDFYGVTIAWGIEGVVLAYLGYRFTYLPPRVGGAAALVLSAGRFFTMHWPLHAVAFPPVLNKAFGSAVFVALAGAAYVVVHHLHRKDASPLDRGLKVGCAIISGLFMTVIGHVEVWQWLELSGRWEMRRWATALVWEASSVAFLGMGLWLRSIHSRRTGRALLSVAAALVAWEYSLGFQPGVPTMFLNGRCLAGALGALAVVIHAHALRGAKDICDPDEQAVSISCYGVAIFLLTLLASVESWQWFRGHTMYYTGLYVVPILWAGGSGAYLFAGVRLRALPLRAAGWVAAGMAMLFVAFGYGLERDAACRIVLNGRFLAGFCVAFVTVAHAAVCRRRADLCAPDERTILAYLYGVAVLFFFLVVSVETYLYFINRIGNPARARRAAQMALSIVWGGYASVLLIVGFRRRVRPVRLAALGLFGATALKLVLADMENAQEIHRIISFIVLGALMIGASYLYHRVEKQLE